MRPREIKRHLCLPLQDTAISPMRVALCWVTAPPPNGVNPAGVRVRETSWLSSLGALGVE
jgi:hypothetical protein